MPLATEADVVTLTALVNEKIAEITDLRAQILSLQGSLELTSLHEQIEAYAGETFTEMEARYKLAAMIHELELPPGLPNP